MEEDTAEEKKPTMVKSEVKAKPVKPSVKNEEVDDLVHSGSEKSDPKITLDKMDHSSPDAKIARKKNHVTAPPVAKT